MPIDFTLKRGDPELVELGIHSNDYRADYEKISADLKMYARQDNRDDFLRVVHHMGKADLFFLCYFVLDLPVNDPFLLARINEAQDTNHMTLDLWSREHWKSTILTFAMTIWDFIRNKEERCCIFSHTRSLAKSHLRRIKQALESNELLLDAFPDVFYRHPISDAPKWSEDEGIYVKRFKTYNEASLEAWGLIDGMPTGKHYTKRIYDDIITEKSVNTPAQVQKATEMFRLSENLGARGGQKRVIGTRYSHRDTYDEIMKNHRWKVRTYPAEVDEKGKFKIGGKPVYLTREELNTKFDEMGEYIYCLDGETKILMDDFRIKDIKDVVVGDSVVGVMKGDLKNRGEFVSTRVLGKWRYENLTVVKITLANGDEIICTPEHKWWTGRWKTPNYQKRNEYSPAGIGYGKLSSLMQILSFKKISSKLYSDSIRFWIGGFFDGEGSVSSQTLTFSQSHIKHPEICKKLEENLQYLNFDYKKYIRTAESQKKYNRNSSDSTIYCLRGGRQLAFDFINLCDPVKRYQVLESLFKYTGRIFSRSSRIKIKSIEPIGERTVYAIETGTGNYIANGYVSSNSAQMGQDPRARSNQQFIINYLRFWDRPDQIPKRANTYLIVDPASEKKKSSDSTTMQVWKVDGRRCYWLVDMVRDKLNLGQRWTKMRDLVEKYNITNPVGYEKYGKDSDIEYFLMQQQEEGKFFQIEPLKGNIPKWTRIMNLMPLLQKQRIILPRSQVYLDVEKKYHELIGEFIHDEYTLFPFSRHDDMLDCMARLLDPALMISFPTVTFTEEEANRRQADPFREEHSGGTTWMSS